ncbi:MAG: GTPase HflX [Tissierellia bacterium]|nr:GTPase HflX [Tissierellia bacterium]
MNTDMDSYRQREMESLISSAGGILLSTCHQNRKEIDPKTFFGKGKVEYFKQVAEELDAELVIVGEEVSPSQLNHLIDALERPVMDRNMVILELFSQRATTNFGKLQVELATKEYMYPRLAGARNNLDRQGGAGNLRGKGEQKLELDRRRLRKSIDRLKECIKKSAQVEDTKARSRRESKLPTVSFVGYSNTGKSTLLNRILEFTEANEQKKVYADDRLFATLDTHARFVTLPHGAKMILSDTVGLVRDLPHQLIDAFSSTLGEIESTDLLIEVVDLSNPYHDMERETTKQLLEELSLGDTPKITVYNKADRVPNIMPFDTQGIVMSAFHQEDIYKLLCTIEEVLFGPVQEEETFFTFEEGSEMNAYLQNHKLCTIHHDEDGVYVKAFGYAKGEGLYDWI